MRREGKPLQRRRVPWMIGAALIMAILAVLVVQGRFPRAFGRPASPPVWGQDHVKHQGPWPGLPEAYVDGPEAEQRIPSEPDLVRLFPHVVLRRGDPTAWQVALTFDDGPDDVFTPAVLDVLQRYDAKATFFIVGAMAQRHMDVARRIVQEGHEVGHHGYEHVDFSQLSDAGIREQLARTEAVFDQNLRVRPTTFRPPYSALNPRAVEVIAEAGYRIILWTIDSLDWRGLPPEDILNNVVPELVPGAIVLMHSAGGDLSGTVAALPLLLEALHERGFTPVTVSELLKDRLRASP